MCKSFMCLFCSPVIDLAAVRFADVGLRESLLQAAAAAHAAHKIVVAAPAEAIARHEGCGCAPRGKKFRARNMP